MHSVLKEGTNNALLLQWDDAVLDPEAPSAHHVGEHHVSREAVTDHCDVGRVGHAGLWIFLEVLHDFGAAARFLHRMV